MLGLRPEKIAVIHSGIAAPFFDASAEAMDAVRARYRLNRPFVLFIGTIEPRKNIDLLLDAYEALPASVRQEFELVVAGPMGWAPAETAARVRSVRYLGYIPEPDIAPLTAAATVFAYPVAVRRLRIPGGAGDGRGDARDRLERLIAARNHGRCGLAHRSPKSRANCATPSAGCCSRPLCGASWPPGGACAPAPFAGRSCAERSLVFFREVAGG